MKLLVKSKTFGDHYFFIDDEDYPLIKDRTINLHKGGQFLYLRLNNPRVYLHRFLMNSPRNKVIDHINRNPLDNRKSNLRIVTIQKNLQNQKRPNNKTGHTGVSIGHGGKYSAQIKVNYKKIHLGTFDTIEDAYKARLQAEQRYFYE